MRKNFKSLTKLTNDSISSSDTTLSCPNILVTLRRMKIEENALTKEIYKTCNCHEDEEYKGNNKYLEFKKYCCNLKSSLFEIKNLYEEVKVNTTSEDNLQVLDIDDVKKDVLGLENKIKTMKAHLQSELKTLKAKEHDLLKEVYGKVSDCNKTNGTMRLPKPKLTEVVSSPVKVLINSPFKCPEVQQFQNFMKSSRNRCGGWNAYHHNIFEQAWRKYFGTDSMDYDEDLEYLEEKQKNSGEYQLFLQELIQKIPGILMKDLIGHHKWYTQYTHLKNRQQKALNRWRANKKLIVKHLNKNEHISGHVSKLLIDKMDHDVINSVVSDEIEEIEKAFLFHDNESEVSTSDNNSDDSKEKFPHLGTTKEHRLRYLQHTAQWKSRCNSLRDTTENNFNIQDVEHLGVPVWRSRLSEKL